MARVNRPGPKGTSCLTCKQRHKKCDQRVPTCERCEKGGFDCLGYEHNSEKRFPIHFLRPKSPLTVPRPHEIGGTECSKEVPEGSLLQEGLLEETIPTTSAPSVAAHMDICVTRVMRSSRTTKPNADTYPWRAGDLLLWVKPNVPLTESPISTFQRLSSLFVQLPRYTFDPLKMFLASPLFDDYLLAQYGKLVDQWYFKPISILKQRFHQDIAFLLWGSRAWFSRWIALIAMGICEAFITGDASQSQLHSLWIGYIENSLKRELSSGTTSREVQTRRCNWVYVSLLRTLITNSSGVYKVLRSITPTFLQLVFSDPALWSSGSSLAYVPLLNVLTVGSHELAYFALIDCTCAMAFGLAQLVEYDTTIHAMPSASPSHQWAHGSPTEFQVVLAAINACRDQSPSARDWREIEHWLLAWQPRPGEYTFTESWMTIAWYAVQESWRLGLLSYLYLAVCDAASDDPRIQTRVKQLLQVIGTVRTREPSSAKVSFLVQYLIAGICARSEGQRKTVRVALEKSKEPRLWIMRGSDFVPVLDHLWHGAAVDGRPVKWGDYMRSREAMLPIVL